MNALSGRFGGGRTYDWDNRLRTVTVGSHATSLRYVPEGDRIYKGSDSIGSRKYILDLSGGLSTVLLEIDANDGSLEKTYIWANGEILVQHNGDYTANRYFYLHDRLSSVRMLVGQNGAVVNHYTYEPFGMNRESGGVFNNYFRFAGEWYDGETVQYYLRARQYDAFTGRFTSRDPVDGEFEEPTSLHPYLYCNNDPVNRTDPSGELWGVLRRAKYVSNIVNSRASMMTAALATTDNAWDASIELEAIHNMHAMVVINKNALRDWYFIREPGEDYLDCMGRCFWGALKRQGAFWFGVGSVEQLTHKQLWGARIEKEGHLAAEAIGRAKDSWWLAKKMQTMKRVSPRAYGIMVRIFGDPAKARTWGTKEGARWLTFGLFGTALAGEEILCTHRCSE